MSRVNQFVSVVALLAAGVFGAASTARAQATSDRSPWSVDFAIGWDNDISGNINSSGIGTVNNQAVVILKNSYEDVYGTGLHMRGGVGYMLSDQTTELRATLTFQSLDADFVTPLGDIGVSKLYGQYSDYQALMLDLGGRQYYEFKPRLRAYGDGTIGIGFIDKIDLTLVAPGANVITSANDVYDQTVAFSLAGDAGVLFERSDSLGIFVQLGLRWTSGLAEIDDLVGTGLDSINDKSSRWTIPFLAGIRYRF